MSTTDSMTQNIDIYVRRVGWGGGGGLQLDFGQKAKLILDC